MQKRIAVAAIVLVLLSVFILFHNSFAPFAFVTGILQSVLRAPKIFMYDLKTDEMVDPNVAINNLKNQNKKLTEQLVEYSKLKKENEALRSQFEIAEDSQEHLLPARVVGSLGNFAAPHTLIIDKGSDHKVIKGAGVLIEKNLVGIIGTVSKQYSQVILVTNPSFTTIGTTSNQETQGIVKGFDDVIVFERVAITETLKSDLVVTRGAMRENGVGIPPDLIIGKITDINKRESEPFQTAKIVSSLKFADLSNVFVTIE
jgi:rod shape-determining protein MreC